MASRVRVSRRGRRDRGLASSGCPQVWSRAWAWPPSRWPGRPKPHRCGRSVGTAVIAFVADTDSGAQLFTVRANGHGLRQLTNMWGGVSAPDWSPDGRSILYEHDLPDDQGSTLEVVRATAATPEPAEEPGVFLGAASYTPQRATDRLRAVRPGGQCQRDLEPGPVQRSTARDHRADRPRHGRPKGLAERAHPELHDQRGDHGNGLYACALSTATPRVVPIDR